MKITKKLFYISIIPLILLVFITVISLIALAANRTKAISYFDEIGNRQDKLQEIYYSMGYTGGIHAFKNYVIRRSNKYHKQAKSKLNLSLMEIDQYLTIPSLTKTEYENLIIVKSTLTQYLQNLELVKKNRKLRTSVLDKLVKIDDEPANQSLIKLTEHLKLTKNQIRKEINQLYLNTLIFIGMTTFIILVVTLFFNHNFNREFIKSFSKIVNISTFLKKGTYEFNKPESYPDDELGQFQKLLVDIASKFDITLSQIKRSNEHLKEFVYIASHDLQEPIKKSSNYIDLVRIVNKNKFDEQTNNYLKLIKRNTTHMHDLVSALLNYSKLSNHELQKEEWDLNLIINDAINIVEEKLKSKNGKIIIERDLPIILGERILLISVFQNLFSNAIKYSAPNRAPVIKIDFKQKNKKRILISVSDNGIGFNEEYIDTILRPFGRLPNSTYEKGLGIGLASCKRIIDLHRGWLRVNSIEGEGSTFSFSLEFKSAHV